MTLTTLEDSGLQATIVLSIHTQEETRSHLIMTVLPIDIGSRSVSHVVISDRASLAMWLLSVARLKFP